ncbi:MAG: hypothetical protein FJX65_19620 [Alphaproteobacteria bacterium]|nr:hypothetical protein [Alphaproteobacteria bacterium]
MTPAAQMRGFAAPQTADGRAALYGPPPWRFEGFVASVFLAVERTRIAALVPPPLRLADDPIVRLSVLDLVCDYGLGPRFAQDNPDQAQVGEAAVDLLVERQGRFGLWSPYRWCSRDAVLSAGREFFGRPQRLGAMSLTRQPFRGWRSGDTVSGLVVSGHRAVFEFAITLEQPANDRATAHRLTTYSPIDEANDHYTQTALPHPVVPNQVLRRLYRTRLQGMVANHQWSGIAEVRFGAPELEPLGEGVPLYGRWAEESWVMPYPEDVIAVERAPP